MDQHGPLGYPDRDFLYEQERRRFKAIELDIKTGQTLVLELEATPAQEVTIDWRQNDDAIACYLSNYKAVALLPAEIADSNLR